MAGGRAPKRKGTRVERQLVTLLLELGFVCSRVPLSGAVGGAWSGDIHLELLGRVRKIEVKTRREFRTLYRWVASADLLLLKADRMPPLAVLPLPLLAELAAAATSPPATAPTTDINAHISFDVAPGQIFCRCGAKVNSFCLHRRRDGTALVFCPRCGAEVGRIVADVEARE